MGKDHNETEETGKDYLMFLDYFEPEGVAPIHEVKRNALRPLVPYLRKIVQDTPEEGFMLISAVIAAVAGVELVWNREEKEMAFKAGWCVGGGDLAGLKELQAGYRKRLEAAYD